MKVLLRIIILFLIFYLIFYLLPFSNVKPDTIFYHSEDKLWMHRLLDPKNENDNLEEFPGYEIDVFYNKKKNIFEVKHHGKEYKHTLLSFFSEFRSLEGKYFWIDFKNLNSDNFVNSKAVLDYLCNKYNIKERIIIESKNIAVLKRYKESDYFISYWLPNYHLFGSIFSIFDVRSNILKVIPNAISCDYHSLHFYTKKFPNYTIHCWTNEMVEEKDKERILKISKNENIRIILTDFKDNFLKK
jgi:hypothetical protein